MGGKLAMVISLLAPKYVNKVIIADIAPIDYDNDEAHSAAYDSDVTAKVFCSIINKFDS